MDTKNFTTVERLDDGIKAKAHQIAWESSKHYDPNSCKQEWCEMAAREMASWFKEQEGRKNTWSEEDNNILNGILSCIEHCRIEDIVAQYNGNRYVDPTRYEPMSDWLKSLKPQPHWKPTQEQLTALKIVKNGFPSDDLDAIETLYNDLKKL